MALTSLPRWHAESRRLRHIVAVLARHGLADWLRGMEWEWLRGLVDGAHAGGASPSREARVRMALTELGPTFVKLGQVLSTRPDVVGPAMAAELSGLQDDTPPDPPQVVRATIEREFGRPIESMFTTFEDEPLASASIAQVHAATLPTGDAVVVKVQHPGIEQTMIEDLDILETLARVAEASDELKSYQPRLLAAEMRRVLMRELDFARERRNLDRFVRRFRDDERVRFPRPMEDWSSRRVLTMERLDGVGVGQVQRLRQMGVDTGEIARRGAQIYLDMIFRDGFYHADPHPGNIRVLPDGRLGLLDTGRVGAIDEPTQELVEGVLLCIVNQNAEELAFHVLRLSKTPQELDRDALRTDLADFISDYGGQTVRELDVSGALQRIVETIRRHHLILRPNVAMLIQVLIVLEGTGRQLQPTFSLAEVIKPYYTRLARRRMTPLRLLQRLARRGREWDRLVDMLPRELADLLTLARSGRLDVGLHHTGLDNVINRLVLGLITASLLLASSLLWVHQAPPRIAGVSITGVVSFLAAIGLTVKLLWSITRSGGLKRKD